MKTFASTSTSTGSGTRRRADGETYISLEVLQGSMFVRPDVLVAAYAGRLVDVLDSVRVRGRRHVSVELRGGRR